MDYRRPDPAPVQKPEGARVEDDFVRPLKPLGGVSHRRLPAALPFAIAGILVVSSVAFGTSVFRSLVTPTSSATPVVVVGDDPTDAPVITDAPVTDAPVTDAPATDAPVITQAPVVLTLSVEALPGKAKLTWSAYTGADFGYYKVVRSTDATATWPLGDGDTLIAATPNPETLTNTDCIGAGTFTYRVFAVKSADAGYEVLVASNPQTVTIAAPPVTQPPAPPIVSNPADLGAITAHDNGNGTWTFSWNAYTGGTAFSYYKLDGEAYPKAPGYVETGSYWGYVGPDQTSITVPVKPGTWNIVVEAVYYPSGKAASVAKSNVLKLTVAGGTQTAPPIVGLGGGITGTDNGDNTFTIHLTWTKYTGPYFSYYGIVKSGPSTSVPGDPTISVGQTPADGYYFDDVNRTSADYKFSMGTAAKTVKFKIWAYSDQSFALSGGLMPACTVETILGASNVLTFVIPARQVTPPPATPTPTAPPTDTPPPTEVPAT